MWWIQQLQRRPSCRNAGHIGEAVGGPRGSTSPLSCDGNGTRSICAKVIRKFRVPTAYMHSIMSPNPELRSFRICQISQRFLLSPMPGIWQHCSTLQPEGILPISLAGLLVQQQITWLSSAYENTQTSMLNILWGFTPQISVLGRSLTRGYCFPPDLTGSRSTLKFLAFHLWPITLHSFLSEHSVDLWTRFSDCDKLSTFVQSAFSAIVERDFCSTRHTTRRCAITVLCPEVYDALSAARSRRARAVASLADDHIR